MMKACVINDKLKVGFIDLPIPEIGPSDVLLKIKYIGLCGSDLNTYRGLNPLVTLPRIPGHEIAAVIVKRGVEVPDEWKEGMAVTVSPYTSCGRCPACLAERPNCCQFNQTLGVQRDGALTEYISAPWQKLFSAENMDLKYLALIEPLTVGNHAADRCRINEDDITAVFGCGAVGLGAVIGVAAKGARVIAIDVDDAKLNLAKKFGAHYVINSSTENLHQSLSELTGGNGPHSVIEAVGLPQTFLDAVAEVAFAGSVTYIGYAKHPVEYETKLFVQKELDIRGSRNAMPGNFRRVIRLVNSKHLPIPEMITNIYSFKNAGTALEDWNKKPASVCRMLIDMES